MTAPSCKTEVIAGRQAEAGSHTTFAPTPLHAVPDLAQPATHPQQDHSMAIHITLVPAGQPAPAAAHVLARIQCRRTLPPREQLLAQTADQGTFCLPLPSLASADYDELWLVDEPVQSLQFGPVQIRRSGAHQLCWLWFDPCASGVDGALEMAVEPAPAEQPSRYQQQSYTAYQQLLTCQSNSPGQAELQKIWHYLPALNLGEGDTENYRQFCLGRERALQDANFLGPESRPLPAATAIGIPDTGLPALFYWLASSQSGINVENPRQTQAWRYPRQYGPARPNFSRATCSTSCNQFLISGTASVVGHATAHPFATSEQTREMLTNLATLAEQGLGIDPAYPGLQRLSQLNGPLRIYLRRPQDLPSVLSHCHSAGLPRDQLLAFHGDICRSDLMVEMDGSHTLRLME